MAIALTDVKIRKAERSEKPYRLYDSHGLYVEIYPNGSKYWRLKYRFAGKEKRLALGVYPEVSLAEARRKAFKAREAVRAGTDPLVQRKQEKLRRKVAAADSFEAIAREWHGMKSKAWAKVTSDKALTHLETYAFPQIGTQPVSTITAPVLLAMLRKVESKGIGYTATRLREMCGQIFRYAVATGRAERNPVTDLVGAIVKPSVKHRPAITDRREFALFLKDLQEVRCNQVVRMAIRFAMLSFTRAQEMRFAKWEEVDWDAREWRVPARRMKMGKNLQAHVVPLASQTLALLRELQALTGTTPYLFPNVHGADGVISENTVGKVLNGMGYQGRQCAHGFRATARSLLAEQGWSREAMERQLDHAERSATVAAYARAEHLEERRRMMQAWADLLDALESTNLITNEAPPVSQ